jgi:hypothetical protein
LEKNFPFGESGLDMKAGALAVRLHFASTKHRVFGGIWKDSDGESLPLPTRQGRGGALSTDGKKASPAKTLSAPPAALLVS